MQATRRRTRSLLTICDTRPIFVRTTSDFAEGLAVPDGTDGSNARPVLAIGSDHLGAEMRATIKNHLIERGYTVEDFGGAPGEEVDYPDIAVPVARAVAADEYERAVLVCGTGIGMAIAANKIAGVRAASVGDVYSAVKARTSNNAQILCLGAQVVGPGLALKLVDAWLDVEFGGGRSAPKVAKIDALDAVRR
jgi:ribose 5-phosphate isomerase B